MVLIFFRLVPSFNLSLCPDLHSHSLPLALRLISSGLFPFRLHLPPPSFSPSRLHPLPASLPLNLALRLASAGLYALCLCPDLHPPSLPLAIFLHLELSLSCLFSISRPSVNPSGTPSLSYLSFLSGLSILPGLATPSPLGYTSVLQIFCPSQI